MRVTIVIFITSFLIMKSLVRTEEAEDEEDNENLIEAVPDSNDHESEEEEDDSASPQKVTSSDVSNDIIEDDAPTSSPNQPEKQEDVLSLQKFNGPIRDAVISNFNLHHPGRRGDSFSFHRLNGPLSKDVREVAVPNSNPLQAGSRSIDYVGKPDYSFAYGVHDDQSKNSHTHMESRDGDSLHGEYRVLQPDGLVRIVRYTADPTHGFKMSVEYAKF